jgi:hypothetical protein
MLFPGFPDESLENRIAFGDKSKAHIYYLGLKAGLKK